MTRAGDHERADREAATEWFVRLQDADCAPETWRAFQAWLDADPANGAAFDEVEALWIEVEAAEGLIAPSAPAEVVDFAAATSGRGRSAKPGRSVWVPVAAALAACALVAVFVAPKLIAGLAPPPVAYATAAGQTRTVTLDDGSHIAMNGATQLSVAMAKAQRSVILTRGEASFDVAHDPSRPFVIAAADRQIRVLGTEFNVLKADGQLTVTVRRGVVAVDPSPQALGQKVRLEAGQQLVHAEGQADSTVASVDPERAFAWRSGRLVYQDRPLGEVASDLGRYFQRPIHVDAAVASMRFTGVLFIDDQEAVVRRLEKFLPIRAEVSPSEIRLTPGEGR